MPFLKGTFKESGKLNKCFRYLKYDLRYDILNLDNFVPQKRSTA